MLFLQCDEDERDYGRAFPELTIVRSPLGLHQTANFISQFWEDGTKVLQLHDDIKQVNKFVLKENGDGKQPTATREPVVDLGEVVVELFGHMENHGAHLGGIYLNNNAKQGLGNRDAVSTKNAFIHDPFTALIVSRGAVVLEDKFKQKKDAERSVKYFILDSVVVRMNHYGMEVQKHNSSSATGGFGLRTLEQDQQATRVFLEQYGAYVERTRVHADGISGFQFRPYHPRPTATADKALQQYERRLLKWQQQQQQPTTTAPTTTAPSPAVPQPHQQPQQEEHEYDVKGKWVQCETQILEHKNTANTDERYALIWRNNDTKDERSQRIRAEQKPEPTKYLTPNNSTAVQQKQAELLAELRQTKRWKGEKQQKYGGMKGVYLNFGITILQTRVPSIMPKNWDYAKANTSHPRLFKLLREYSELCWGADFFSDKGYHAVFVAKCKDGTSITNFHVDSSNVGRSVIHGLGDYDGGMFVVRGSISGKCACACVCVCVCVYACWC